MSQVAMYRTRLNFRIAACGDSVRAEHLLGILREAVQIVANEHGGSVSKVVYDGYGRPTPCDFAVVAPRVPHGVGVVINKQNGTLDLVHDCAKSTAQEVSDAIIQSYVAIATIRALKTLGYRVREEPTERQVVALTAVL